MPKRARCPHCDRLFNREMLDDHIRKCRARRRDLYREHHPRRKTLIVDGNNVAYYLSSNGQPQGRNLLLAYHSLLSGGYRPVVVVSAALKHKIEGRSALTSLRSRKCLVEAKRGTDDDLTVIRLAKNKNADIVSNDRFLKYRERYTWITSRLRRYRLTPSGLILL